MNTHKHNVVSFPFMYKHLFSTHDVPVASLSAVQTLAYLILMIMGEVLLLSSFYTRKLREVKKLTEATQLVNGRARNGTQADWLWGLHVNQHS